MTHATGYHFANNSVQNVSTASGSNGKLHGLILGNAVTAITYYQFFLLTATNVTLGTTVPAFVIPVPASLTLQFDTDYDGAMPFSALSFVPTTTYNGSTAPATACDAVVFSE